MRFDGRALFPYFALALFGGATWWALSFGTLPPADFTFCNETEIKSVDPHIVTGVPETRIIMALFEGLVRWDPKTLEPLPGVAQRWESPDNQHFTFYLRPDARWSDGTPVTAHDFVWSWRRLLDPLTAAEYSYQAWYIKNAKKYTSAEVSPGDLVEVELNKDADALPGARGKLLHGKLVRVDEPKTKDLKVYVVEIDGRGRRFISGDGVERVDGDYCKQVLVDFSQVGVEAVDDRTLKLTLENPTPFFLSLTGHHSLYPVNPRCVETYGYPDWVKPQNIICNGAYKLEFHRIRDRTRLVKSDTYWNRDAVQLKTIDALAIESDTTALNLYLTGKADWITTVPPTVVPELLRLKLTDFNPSPELTSNFYRFNVTRPPLDNLKVRQALSRAIDRQEICTAVLKSGEVPGRSLVPPGFEGYERGLCPDFDPVAARQLLAEAGYPQGRGFPKLELLYNANDDQKSIAELIQSQWKKNLDINVSLQQLEWSSYLARQQQMQYQICRAGWIGDYVDPNTFLDMFLTGGTNNNTGWGNAEYDRLIAAAGQATDPKQRFQLLHDAEVILMSELPIMPLYYRVSKNLVRPYVHGLHNNLLDLHPLWAVSVDTEAKQEVQRR